MSLSESFSIQEKYSTLNKCKFLRCWILTAAAVLFLAAGAWAQSLVAGDILGTVTDSSNAVIPNVVVNLKSLDTGATLNSTTNATGAYRFTLLKPGTYRVEVNQSGFAPFSQTTTVAVGQITTANISLKVSGNTTVVEVTGEATLISTEPGSTTSFSKSQMELLPSAGADLTNIAQTAPGVSMNIGGGSQYGGGNFTVNGLPGVSNLFTVNGENDMDPYFNVNNSGATNLTLGQNEIAEAAVITNAYSGQYGQLSGAQVTLVTKSGSNQFHGNAQWWWNGDYLNANDWMNKNAGGVRPFSNNNQWATSVGGPIIKNKTFFFVDYEGVRFVLPSTGLTGSNVITVPTPAFATAVENNIAAVQPNSLAEYTKMFNLYNAVSAGKAATPFAIAGCNALALPGFTPSVNGCGEQVAAIAKALGHEYIVAVRIDQRIGSNDTLYGRYKLDRGLQPTLEDQISPNFDANSSQPSYDMQLNETHIFSPRSTNQLMVTGSHYVAQFAQQQPLANNTFPAFVNFGAAIPFAPFNFESDFPQGRNVTQYQIIDDFTLIRGRHSLKFGENFRRYLVSDHTFLFVYPEVQFGAGVNDLASFSNGLARQYEKSLNINTDVPERLWGFGAYAQDEWSVTRSLKLTLALRMEHYSNPVCGTKCFANFVGPYNSLPSVVAGAAGGSVPYNQDIRTGVANAFSGVDGVDLSPRIGFSWSPRGNSTLVLSGGFGIFYDGPPAGLLEQLTQDPPNSTRLHVEPPTQTLGFDPTPAGSAFTWQQSANAFHTGFVNGGTFNSISSNLSTLGVAFAAPNFTSLVGTFHSPRYLEWNFQVQKELHRGTAVIVNYVGNSGEKIPYANAWLNTYQLAASPVYTTGLVPTGAPPNPNYGTVTQWQSGAISNFNGLNISLREQFSTVAFHLNYGWGHALDEISNGGATGNNASNLYNSIVDQINPTNLRKYNYGNADYDVRHSLSFDWVYSPSMKAHSHLLNAAANGWQWSGKAFIHSGLPFTVTDGNYAFNNGGSQGYSAGPGGGIVGLILAQPVAGQRQSAGCAEGNAGITGSPAPCLFESGFLQTGGAGYPNFSTQERNQYRGPHYIDFDMGLAKNFSLYENVKLGLGAQAFNVFNHPNFNIPNHDISTPGTFGVIQSMAVLPTTPYGSGLGYSSQARLLQLTAKVTF